MRIINLRVEPFGSGRRQPLARFDIEVSSDVTLLDWYLKRTGSGQLRVFPPSPRQGNPSARVSPALMYMITTLAVAACPEGVAHYDQRAA